MLWKMLDTSHILLMFSADKTRAETINGLVAQQKNWSINYFDKQEWLLVECIPLSRPNSL